MTATCPGHHRDGRPRPLNPNTTICDACQARTAAHLNALPELWDDCETALVTHTRSNADKIKHRPEPGLSLSQPAIDARTAIRAEITSWSRIVVEERHLTAAPADTIAAGVRFLLRNIDWIAAQTFAPEFSRTIADTVQQARAAAYPSGARKIILSPCPVDLCQGQLVVYLRPDDDLLPAMIRCSVVPDDPSDRHEWAPDAWMALGRQLMHTGTSDLIAAITRSA